MSKEPEASGQYDSDASRASKKTRSAVSRSIRRRAEKKRKKAANIEFTHIIECIDEGFVALDSKMNYTYINQRGSELLMRKPEDLVGKNYWQAYPQDKETSFGQAYLRALETQNPIELEDYYAAQDRWFENRIYPVENGLFIFFSDITERKRNEEQRNQLLQSEQTQRASAEQELAERKLAEQALGMWASQPLPHEARPLWNRYGVTAVITALAVLLRVVLTPVLQADLPLATIFGAVAFSVWYGGGGPALFSLFAGYLAAEWFIIPPYQAISLTPEHLIGFGLFLLSSLIVMGLGEEMRRARRHAHQSAQVALARQQQAELRLIQQQRVEEALRDSEKRERVRASQLEAIMEAVPAVIWIAHDPECQLVTGNRASYEALRLPVGGNASLSAPESVWPEHFEVWHDGRVVPPEELPFQRAARGEEVSNYEEELRFADGTSVYLFGNAITLRDAEGIPSGALAAFVEITERKRAEEELRQLNLQSEQRVYERTAELRAINEQLVDEMQERRLAEEALRESHARLQTLSQRLVEVQEEERRAIANELHDAVGQSLAALNLNLTIINNLLSPIVNRQVKERLTDSVNLVVDVMDRVRDVMSDLRPSVLDDFGLEAALKTTLDKFKLRYGLNVRFDQNEARVPRLGPGIEMTLLRIAQEGLLNVARHAQTQQAALSLQLEVNAIRLQILDNGMGLPVGEPVYQGTGGHGLKIMRERAEAVGGALRVSSSPGQGTQIEVHIPFQLESRKGNV